MSDAVHPTRWGILSTARVNRHFVAAIKTSSVGRLVAVASRTLEAAETYAKQESIPIAYGSYKELLESSEIDAVYITLPQNLHEEWVIAACQAKKHVLCEKPLTLTGDSATRIREAARVNNVVVEEAFMHLHTVQTATLHKLCVQDKRLGALHAIRGHFAYHERRGGFRTDREAGGGSLFDVGVYPLSLAMYLMGKKAPKCVMAVEQVAPQTDADSTKKPADEGFHMTLVFEEGCVAQLSSGFVGPLRVSFEVAGDKGLINLPAPFKPAQVDSFTFNELKKRSPEAPEPEWISETIAVKQDEDGLSHLYQGEIDHFSKALQAPEERDKWLLGLDFSVKVARTVDAMLLSASQGGTPVAVTDVA